ncbi:MAG: molybdopterin molybdotransferase MoeA [Gemmatimonadetes bacterium]|nr:molybdopterin molybdotransferase MoeA [Gemmatimonadota bacterium]
MADFERLRADWLSFDEALARILADASPMPETDLAPLLALGRSLARPVSARATLPAWPNSAMDGYAVRSGELAGRDPGSEVRLPVAGRSYPGSVPLEDIAPGAAVRVMTGGPLPLGFDSVIRVEHTDAEDAPGFVVLRRLDDVGKHVRSAGKDMRAGDETVAAGAVVHSGTLPVISASGSERVFVYRRPRVGVMSSGDELVGSDRFERVIAGRGIPDSNRDMIAAGVVEAGGVPVDLGIAPDDPAGLESRLASLAGIDLLVTTGGASMGEKDLLKRILLRFPFRLDFWRARVRPGSPLSFGHLRTGEGQELPVFGLPGNPASAFVTFHVLVAPYLRARLGAARPAGVAVTARTDDELRSARKLTQFFRVRLREDESGWTRCALTGPQGSGLVRSLPGADGLAVVPEGRADIRRNDPVSVILLQGRR